jgi:hypothetical protein
MQRLLPVLLLVACERAPRQSTDGTTVLRGVATLPPIEITVSPFLVRGDLPAAYNFMGGSLRDGFLAHLVIGSRESCAPRCDRETIEQRGALRVGTCGEPDGRTIWVEHPGRICCSARWTVGTGNTPNLTAAQQRVADSLAASCLELRLLR